MTMDFSEWLGEVGIDSMQIDEYNGGEKVFDILAPRIAELENKIADIKANCDLAIEGRDIKIKELENQVKDLEWQLQEVAKDNDYYQAENKKLEQQIEKMKEVISELIAITDKDICKECDGGIHCSECYVNHAQTYASHFINEKEIEK